MQSAQFVWKFVIISVWTLQNLLSSFSVPSGYAFQIERNSLKASRKRVYERWTDVRIQWPLTFENQNLLSSSKFEEFPSRMGQRESVTPPALYAQSQIVLLRSATPCELATSVTRTVGFIRSANYPHFFCSQSSSLLLVKEICWFVYWFRGNPRSKCCQQINLELLSLCTLNTREKWKVNNYRIECGKITEKYL